MQFAKTVPLLFNMSNVLRHVGTVLPLVNVSFNCKNNKASLKYKRMLLVYCISVN